MTRNTMRPDFETKKTKVIFLPNFITAFGLACGLFAIFRLVLVPVHQLNGLFFTEIVGLLLLAALADILDGAVARAMKAESEFGGLFDSLADAVSFGVAPSVFILRTLPPTEEGKGPFVVIAAAMIFSLCGVLRLVRYNIQASKVQEDEALILLNKKFFTGLPIPGGAACALSLGLLLVKEDLKFMISLSEPIKESLLSGGVVLLGYFMISRWKFPSIKTLQFPIGSFETVFITVLATVALLYGLILHFSWLFFLISWGYLIVSLTLSMIRIVTGKKVEQLQAFDPECEDEFVD